MSSFDTNIYIWDKQRSSKWKRRDSMLQCNKTIEKTINFDDAMKEETKEHSEKWSQISDHQKRAG